MRVCVLMENTSSRPDLVCEHGLSLYIEACGKRILFDAGQSSAFADNALAMGVDLSSVDLAILSHGHYDHSGGLLRFLKINDHAPVYVSRHAFGAHLNASGKYIGVDPALASHPRIVMTDDACALSDTLSLSSCNALANGVPPSARGMSVLSGGQPVQDHFLHEQYLTILEGGRRIVISGCSHKGILNIVSWLRPDVLIGGFHFMKLDPLGDDAPFLSAAADALLAHPCVYYTGHCTGEPAFAFLKQHMGGALRAISTGSIFTV